MYQFTEDCLIGIEQIDNEHRTLFEMINEATAQVESKKVTRAITEDIILRLKVYAATHFSHEEEYMLQINDPELPNQRREHAAFIAYITSYDFTLLNDENAASILQDILVFLVHWLYRHILSSDMMIGKISQDPFVFSDMYRSYIPFIDEEHKRLFDIIRKTNDLIHAQLLHDKYDEIIGILNELRDYTEIHFSHEEEYMEQIGYPGLEAQRRAHTAFIDRLVDIKLSDLDDIDDNQQEYLNELVNYLLSWLSNHILKMDLLIAQFAKNNKLL